MKVKLTESGSSLEVAGGGERDVGLSTYIFVNVKQSGSTKSGRTAEEATASSTDSNGRLQ